VADPELSSSNQWGSVVLGKQRVVLSSGTGGGSGQETAGQVTFDHSTLNQEQAAQARHHGERIPCAFGRAAAAASLGLSFLGAMAAPADAAHHRNLRDHAETSKEAKKPEPPKQPTGPLLLAVSIGNQKVTVYDNGTPIASSSVSTGMSGHPTPTGIFSVIQKQRWHHSNIYSGAPMPYMQRITWSGVALHAGVVPGYPASHGCIRLPAGFAVRLWGMTKLGARVIITRGDSTGPYEINHPRLAALVKPPEPEGAKPQENPEGSKPEDSKREDSKPEAAAGAPSGAVVVATTGSVSAGDSTRDAPGDGHAEAGHDATALPHVAGGDDAGKTDSAAPPTKEPAESVPAAKGDDVLRKPGHLALFVSRREGKLFVRKGFTPAFDVPVTIAQPEKPLGTHLFTAGRPAGEGAGLRWFGVSFGSRVASGGSSHGKRKGRGERPAPVTADALRQSAADALDRIELPADALARLIPLVTAGTSLVISDQGLGGETGTETDFIVVTK
jgi:lipoprotein-anchoring transpeptidase ErfK/SrfK